MSTILDALRKVEADNHARSPDARARLLFSLSRSDEDGKGAGAIEVDQGLKPLVQATEDTLPAPPVAPAERPPISPAVAVATPSSALSAAMAPPARARAPETD